MTDVQHVHYPVSLDDEASVWVETRRDGAHLVLTVRGEADRHSCGQLRSALTSALEGAPGSVRVDVGHLSFCDLAGSDVLHDFADEAAARAVRVDFRGMSPLLSMMYTTLPRRATPGGPHRRLTDASGT